MGRRTKLTPALQEALCKYLRDGLYLQTACALVGVDLATVDEWRARGEGTDRDRPRTQLHAAFAEAVEKAKAEAVQTSVEAILEAGKDNWTAHAWYLERTQREMYGRPWREAPDSKVPATTVNVAVQLGLSRADVEALLSLAHKLNAAPESVPDSEIEGLSVSLPKLREGTISPPSG